MYKKGVFIYFIFFCVSTFSWVCECTNKLEALKAEREQNAKALKALNVLLFSNKKKEKSAITRIDNINAKTSIRQNLIKITNEQANLLTHQINSDSKRNCQFKGLITKSKRRLCCYDCKIIQK